MRIAPPPLLSRQLTKESWSITKDSTGVTAIVGVISSFIKINSEFGSMSLWMHWWNDLMAAPGVLPPANLPLVRHRRGRLHRRHGHAGRDQYCAHWNLDARCYNTLIDHFHSSAVKLDRLTALWTQVVLRLFPQPLRVNGKVRPGRRRHQDPQVRPQDAGGQAPASAVRSNTKPEFIMGHSLQAVSLLVQAASSFFAVPLAVRIHEGLVWSNRDRRRTLLDKMLALGIAAVEQPFYFVADAYYAAHKIVAGLLKQNNHSPG